MGCGSVEKAMNSEVLVAGSAAINFEMPAMGLPEEIPLLPAGPDIIGRDGRSWKLTDPQRLVDAFAANMADLPIDIEHATELKAPEGEPAPAVGWIKGLKLQDGRIWGQVEWNSAGADLVGGKQYRYISPVFIFDRQTMEIMRLTSAALTNKPNLGLPALNHQQNTEDKTMWKRLCARLGLAETATEDEAMNAVAALQSDLATAKNRAETPSLEKFVPRADFDMAMNRASAAEQKVKEIEDKQLETAINADVDAAVKAGKIAPANKDYYLATCRAEGGLDLFRKFAAAAPVIAVKSGLDGKETPDAGLALNSDQLKITEMFGNSVEDLKKYGMA